MNFAFKLNSKAETGRAAHFVDMTVQLEYWHSLGTVEMYEMTKDNFIHEQRVSAGQQP